MPRATRNRASSPAEAPEEPEEQMQDESGGARLKFKQTLNWRAGKPIAVADLLRRLETLSKELQAYEQDEVDKESLSKTATELASGQLLTHKDKGVKALTACCIVDMFRLCAPDAPYTQQQLKDIFTLIIQTIVPALADPSSAYNRQHLYVLKSLAEVKSIILLTDTPNAANLTEVLFKECFDVLGGPSKSSSNEELSKNVEHHMTSVLSTLVDETKNLPNEVTHTILAQFLRTSSKVAANGTSGRGKKAQIEESQGTLSLKEAPPAYNMAKNICNASPEEMSKNIYRYWGAVVAEASTSLPNGSVSSLKKSKRRANEDDDDEDDEIAKMASQDLEEIKKAHDLLRELWRATPEVLRDIIPSLESELSEENAQKRILAVETVGDMIAGIGHGGPPPATQLNPAAYPSQSLLDPSEKTKVFDFLTTPTSPVSFVLRYHQIYQAFLSRRHDKSAVVRASWATAVGRIILTSAGGVGLSTEEELSLSNAFAGCLQDVDEKVRHCAVKAIERFDFEDIVQKLGNRGGVDDAGSVLANLAERVKDRKKDVRNDALKLLGKIWGVAVGAIGEGSERVSKMLGSIPSRILGAYYINDLEINALVDRIMFESLLPVSYPPIKSGTKAVNGNSQSQGRTRQSQGGSGDEINPDKLRTERVLLLVRSLDDRAKPVFFALCMKQVQLARYMTVFLEQCEKYNGGVVEENEKEVKARLKQLIEVHVRTLPEPQKATDDLWKFAKAHDRRAYALIRFAMATESEYKKVKNAIMELGKKLDDVTGASATFVETITTLVLRCSGLVYNRSHVPAIIEFSRSDENGLGKTAHEVLEKISKDKSEVFKAHVRDLCKSLESEAPTAKRTNEPGAVQDLKACAQFARQFPQEVPKERKFMQSMFAYINHGTPAEAAKYGALVVLLAADKKKMYAKDIFNQCAEGFTYGEGNFLGRLAALGQLMLLGSEYIENEDADVVVDIAINQVLTNSAASPGPVGGEEDPEWTDKMDENCEAKVWALKILVNRLRAFPDQAGKLDDAVKPVFQFLNGLVQKGGQISKAKPSLAAHASRMRLVAAQMLLKLCREKHLSARLSAVDFNNLSLVAMDPRSQVRDGFVKKIMKHLGQMKLSNKFYTPLFLLGHEPDKSIKGSAMTWLKARSLAQARSGKEGARAMEATFARLLSLLAHHPDWPAAPYDEEELNQSLKEFMGFILFYVQAVGTKENLGLVYHVAQRVKAHQDGITSSKDEEKLAVINERLYMLSDLAQGVIRKYLDATGATLQAWPGKVKLPAGIFATIADHETAQMVATKNFLPRDFEEDLEMEVRSALKTKKRKSAAPAGESRSKKVKTDPAERKVKKTKTLIAKTPKKSRANGILSSEANVPSSELRRSGRSANPSKSYIEVSDDEASSEVADEDEDEEMVDIDAAALEEEQSEEEGDADAEEGAEATPEASSSVHIVEEDVVAVDKEDETPTHSSPRQPRRGGARGAAKAASAKATPKKVAAKETPKTATPAKTLELRKSARNASSSSVQESTPLSSAAKGKPAAKAKANGTVKGGRTSKRAKAKGKGGEFDFPEDED